MRGLCLTRKLGEEIIITNNDTGEQITVGVRRIEGKTINLAISAPKNYVILRMELYGAQNGERK